MRRQIPCLLLLSIYFPLAGCGGGGGGGGSNPPASFAVRGNVSGLVGSVTLQNNAGNDLVVGANGAFSFTTPLIDGRSYQVTVLTQPELQTCTVTAGSGTASASMAQVAVSCADVIAPVLSMAPQPIKRFHFSWTAVPAGTRYKLLEDAGSTGAFTQLGADLPSASTQFDFTVPLYSRLGASYRLQVCAATRCLDSNTVSVTGTLAAAVGYLKSANSEAGDVFGSVIALSGDGSTLAVGAPGEDGGPTGGPDNNTVGQAGAVYIFENTAGTWTQRAYLKPEFVDEGYSFGTSVALSQDGSTLAVGAPGENSSATGVNGDATAGGAAVSGAAYIFSRDARGWSQDAYVKASNTQSLDQFGTRLALSADGLTLAVSAVAEDSASNNQADNSALDAGAVYLFVQNGITWLQVAYLKASNAAASDTFGTTLAFSGDGRTLAVAAIQEDSDALGVGGDQSNNARSGAGAVYVFRRGLLPFDWPQSAYVKATSPAILFGTSLALSGDGTLLAVGGNILTSHPGRVYFYLREGESWTQQPELALSSIENGDAFGSSLALSTAGDLLVVGATGDDSNATGLNGDTNDNSESQAGAAYVFIRSGSDWLQRAYLKAPNAASGDAFGTRVACSADGGVIAMGVRAEDSDARGIGGDQSNNGATDSGAVYLY